MTTPRVSAPVFHKPEPQAADSEAVEKAVALLRAARNPMIMIGSGASDAGPAVLRLAESLQAPVVAFRSGRGIISDDHPLGFTCAEGYRRWQETDVVIGIGSRMELLWFRWPQHRHGVKVICIDVDPRQPVRLQAELGLVGDAGKTASLLADLLEREPARASRHQEFTELKQAVASDILRIQPQMDYLHAIRAVLPRDGFVAEESSQAGFTSIYGIPMYKPRTFVSSGHQGTLGYGFPTCLGVKAGNPDKCVVSITGDGGFMFGIQELTTAVEHRINLVTVLFNNQCYGNVLRDQQRMFDGRDIGARLLTPDFRKLAEGFGVGYYTAASPAALRKALEHAFAADAPCLVEVPVVQGSEASPWEFLAPRPY